MNRSDNIGVSPCARRFFRFRSTAALPARAIAFAAAILFSFAASYVHAQELITLTLPSDPAAFEPGSTFSVDVELGGEAAALLASDPTGLDLSSAFSLVSAELIIRAELLDGAIATGIVIGFPQAAYDSVAGTALGGVTTPDGLRIEVNDLNITPIIYLRDDRNPALGHGTTDSRGSTLGPTHNVVGNAPGVLTSPPTLQEWVHLIQAHEITIPPDYTGGPFNLRLTLTESSRVDRRIGERDTITAGVTVGPRRVSRCPSS